MKRDWGGIEPRSANGQSQTRLTVIVDRAVQWAGAHRLFAGIAVVAILSGSSSAAASLPAAALRTRAPVRVVHLTGRLRAYVAMPKPGKPFRPRGKIAVLAGSDPLFSPGDAGVFTSTVRDNIGGKGRFVDHGTIRFSNGILNYQGVYPTTNEPTALKGVLQTVLVEKVTGGTGAFAGATGYFLLNSELRGGDIDAQVSGVFFVRAAP